MHRAVDVGLVVQENTLVELDDVVVVALTDVVLTDVKFALDVIVDDEADVVKFALDVIETEDVLSALELAVEEADVMVADTLADELTEVLVKDTEELETLADELTEMLVRDTEELEALAEPETLVVVLETVLEAVVQFAMSIAPCTLDTETAFPTDFFK